MINDVLQAEKVFSGIASLEENIFPLDRAALAIPLEDYPGMDMDGYLRELDRLAANADVLAGENRDPLNLLECLNEIIFVQQGIRGNTEDYYDPRNSFLNEVLDRKLGIPISLSVIYMEVARRINLPIQGVGLPGHFIVKHVAVGQEILVYGGSLTVQPAFLQPMEKKAIISRMLFNLKGIYYQREDYYRALSIVERILLLNPGIPSEIRDRGLLFMHPSLFAKALADLEHYLSAAAAPTDESFVNGHIHLLRGIVGCEN